MSIKRWIFLLIIILSVVYILLQVPSIKKLVVNTLNQATPSTALTDNKGITIKTDTPCNDDLLLRDDISRHNRDTNPNYDKYPKIDAYAINNCEWVSDIVELKSDSEIIPIFQSVPAGCWSCGTRTVNYLWQERVSPISIGHEIYHTVFTDVNGNMILKITYGLLKQGDTNSNFKSSIVQEYSWNRKINSFDKQSERVEPSLYR